MANGAERATERARDGLLHLGLLEPDAQLAGNELGEVARLIRPQRAEGVANDRPPHPGAAHRRQRRELRRHPLEALPPRRPTGEDIAYHVAHVAVTGVRLRQSLLARTGELRQS